MANHGFITTKQKVTGAKLAAALQEINERRFDGKLKISHDPKSGWDGPKTPTFEIELWEGEGYTLHRLFWLATPHKIEHRHGPGGDFAWWIEDTFANELALMFNGTLSDEGVGEKWKGEKDWCPTFRHFLASHVRPDTDIVRKVALKGIHALYMSEARNIRPDLKRQ